MKFVVVAWQNVKKLKEHKNIIVRISTEGVELIFHPALQLLFITFKSFLTNPKNHQDNFIKKRLSIIYKSITYL